MSLPKGDAYVIALEDLIYKTLGLSGSKEFSSYTWLSDSDRRLAVYVISMRRKAEADAEYAKAVASFDASVAAVGTQNTRVFPDLMVWLDGVSHNLTARTFNQMRKTIRAGHMTHVWGERPTIIDLACTTRAQIDGIPFVGRKALNDLEECLGFSGLRFGMIREEAEAAYRPE